MIPSANPASACLPARPGRDGCGGRRRCAGSRRACGSTPADLVLPMFVREDISVSGGEPQPIVSMPGVVQHTRDSLRKAAAEAVGGGRRRADPVRPAGARRTGVGPAPTTRRASCSSPSPIWSRRSAATSCS